MTVVDDQAQAGLPGSMRAGPQVCREHYDFSRYVDLKRWSSHWYQIHEIMAQDGESVLEIGVGTGLLTSCLRQLGRRVATVDIDHALGPDVVASVQRLPLSAGAFDVVVAFQVLEHLPFGQLQQSLLEMARVSRGAVIVSLPDARTLWGYSAYVPWFGDVRINLPRPRLRAPKHRFDGEHYWEINKRGFELARVSAEFTRAGLRIDRTYRVPENPYHRFFVCNTSK